MEVIDLFRQIIHKFLYEHIIYSYKMSQIGAVKINDVDHVITMGEDNSVCVKPDVAAVMAVEKEKMDGGNKKQQRKSSKKQQRKSNKKQHRKSSKKQKRKSSKKQRK